MMKPLIDARWNQETEAVKNEYNLKARKLEEDQSQLRYIEDPVERF